ncbi:unnamed protein product [Trichobilharzia szidati]|nr:unnamed protein product [Trichobilharzia szidati]
MSGLGDMNLTSDEISKLKNAFKDPEFRKLFREYAEEISDPVNKKKYEDEIKLMELEQGMDVQFINPTPGHCFKTRHWPYVLQFSDSKTTLKEEEKSTNESVKVFINVCRSDAVECPEIKSQKNDSSVHGGGGRPYWSIPHCFTPPREDFDKRKNHSMVYDVVFNPKAFELAKSSIAFKRLLNVTAIEGLQKQYNLCLGMTFKQALHLFKHRKNTDSKNPQSESVYPNSVANDNALLKAVHLLNGVSYKGVARPTVIRRRRLDYEQRQAELKRREAEDLKSCTTAQQKQAMKRLSAYPPYENAETLNEPKDKIEKNVKSNEINGPTKPDYTITYSSDFDMSNCRNAGDVNPLRPPDRLIVNIKFPGLTSSSSLDLDVQKTQLHVASEKPIAYLLDLKLPYEVDASEGTAKFDKSTHTLSVTLPLIKKEEPCAVKFIDTTESNGDSNRQDDDDDGDDDDKECLTNQVIQQESIAAEPSLTDATQYLYIHVINDCSFCPYLQYCTECSSTGMESPSSHPDHDSNSLIPNVTCSSLLSDNEATLDNTNDISSKPQVDDDGRNSEIMNRHHLNSPRFTTSLSSHECCSIECWNTNDNKSVNCEDNNTNINDNIIEESNTNLEDYQLSSTLQSSPNELNGQVNKSNALSTTSERLGHNSSPSNSEEINCQTASALKGILKHCSVSECSGDEVSISDRNDLRVVGGGGGAAGLAGDIQDAVPSEGGNMHLQQTLSTDKLSVVELDGKNVQYDNHLSPCGLLTRSVSFSEHVKFSPGDAVEASHNDLCSIQENALCQEDTHHYHHPHKSDGNLNQLDNEGSSTKLDAELSCSKHNLYKSVNDSASSSETESNNQHNPDYSHAELCDTNPSEHLHDSVFQNCSPLINTSESNNGIDSNQSESLSPKDDLQSNDIISSDTAGTPTTTTTLEEGEGILRIIPECNETDGAHYNASVIPLTAFPLLELDEE